MSPLMDLTFRWMSSILAFFPHSLVRSQYKKAIHQVKIIHLSLCWFSLICLAFATFSPALIRLTEH